ncbi:MAG: WecB/TagA/CpsF family glycosyltransferase, partial [Halanaerobiaceae bacterium]
IPMNDCADSTEILGIMIDRLDMKQAIKRIKNFMNNNNNRAIILTPNPEMIVMAQEDKQLARIINRADLKIPDGAGVVLASRLSKHILRERVAGYDLMTELMNLAVKEEYLLYLLGSKPDVIEKACDQITKNHPGIKIAGFHHGYLDRKLQQEVIRDINRISPDILFVGMGVPLQEKFLDQVVPQLDVKVAMAVGGSFDVLAGKIKRAPVWLQRLNLEWLYRLLQEPNRLGRMMALPRFVWLVLMDRIFGN